VKIYILWGVIIMNHCPNCQFNISEAGSRVPNSKNSKVMVCALCGFPVEPKHRKLHSVVQTFQMSLLFILTGVAVVLSIFVFNLSWWQVILVGIAAFGFFLLLLNNLDGFLFDPKIAKSYNKRSLEDYRTLVETDDRLISKRAVVSGLGDKHDRYEKRVNTQEDAMALKELILKRIDDVYKGGYRGAFTKDEYCVASAHAAKICAFGSVSTHKLLTNQIKHWSEDKDFSKVMREAELFIEEVARRPRLSAVRGNSNALDGVAERLHKQLEIRKPQIDAHLQELNLRLDAGSKLNNALSATITTFSRSFQNNVFTREENAEMLELEKQAFEAELKYESLQTETKVNISVDATYSDILAVEGPVVEFVNTFLPPDEFSEFWEALEKKNEIVASGKGRPNDYGSKKDLENLG